MEGSAARTAGVVKTAVAHHHAHAHTQAIRVHHHAHAHTHTHTHTHTQATRVHTRVPHAFHARRAGLRTRTGTHSGGSHTCTRASTRHTGACARAVVQSRPAHNLSNHVWCCGGHPLSSMLRAQPCKPLQPSTPRQLAVPLKSSFHRLGPDTSTRKHGYAQVHLL